MKRCIPLLLALCLLLSLGSPALADNVLRLPSSLKSIEDDAFNGDTSLGEVVLPEGIESIGKGAFAGSSLTKINLPDSLKTIDDTALPAPGIVTVTANEGSDAYDWAVDMGYIAPAGSVAINAANFPDGIFRAYVSDNFDTEETGKGILSESELAAVKAIYVSEYDIATLTGLEHFTALQYLSCAETGLQSLDVSANTALIGLDCSGNALQNLDVSHNEALEQLRCEGNPLTELDISACPKLVVAAEQGYASTNAGQNLLVYDYDGELGYFQLSLPASAQLTVPIATPAEPVAINAANFPDAAFCGYVSKNFDTNKDGALSEDEANSVTEIHVSNMGIASLKGIEYFPVLSWLDCDGNQLSALDLSRNCMLDGLICYHNDIEVLDLRPCPWLCSLTEEEALTDADYGEDVLLYYPYTLSSGETLYCLAVDADTQLVNTGKDTHLTARFATSEYRVAEGGRAILTVSASCDEEPLTYRWYKYTYRMGEDGNRYAEWRFLSNETGSVIITEPIHSRTGYYCFVSDPYGTAVQARTSVAVETHLSAWATDYRTDIRVSLGETATLTVEASGDATPLRYQWYKIEWRGDVGYLLPYLTPIDGATEPSFTTGPVSTAETYQCAVTDTYENDVTVMFNVTVETHLQAQPKDYAYTVYFSEGETATLEVVASCDVQPLSYQWYRMEYVESTNGYYYDSIPIDGATEPSFSTDQPGNYRCMVTDLYGGTNSVWISVYIQTHLSISPANDEYTVYVDPGESAVLSVTATCDVAFGYQWYRYERVESGNGYYYNSIPIDGATTPTLTTAQSGEYRCTVTDIYGGTNSVNLTVTVNTHLYAYPKDYNYSTVYVDYGESATLTVEASCDVYPLSYQWYQSPQNAPNQRVFGETSPVLETAPVTARCQYYCEVCDIYGGRTTVWFTVAVDTHLTVSPVGQTSYTIQQGETALLAVEVECDVPFTYQWYQYELSQYGYYSFVPINGATAASYTASEAGQFICTVTDTYGGTKDIWFYVYD